MFSARCTTSSRPLQAKAQNIAGIIMDGGHNRRNTGWERSQSYPKVYGYSPHPSEYASPTSSQSSSSSKSYPENNRLIAHPELNPTSSGSLTPFSSRHTSLPSPTTYSRAVSHHEGASHGQLRQDDQPPPLVYNYVYQPTWSQNNPPIRNPYDDQQFQSDESALSPWQLSFNPISPDISLNALGCTAPSEFASQGNVIYGWPNQQRILSPRTQDRVILMRQLSAPADFPSLCFLCNGPNTIFQDRNAWNVHYWTKHSPPPGSPDAWTPKKCLWEGCPLEKDFRALRGWLTHVTYVHQKGYNCPVPGCLSKPFGSSADVQRHHLTKHTPKKYCAKAGCQARRRINLCRKDKMDEHEAMWHGPLMCEVVGCPRRRIDGEDHGFSKRSKLDEHMRQKHPHLHLRSRRSRK